MCELSRVARRGAAGTARDALLIRLRPEFLTDLQVVGRFVTAGRRAMRLSHPSIPRVEEVLAAHDEVGIVTEFIEGSSLRAIIDRVRTLKQTIPVWFGLEVSRRICDALAHAHAVLGEGGGPYPLFCRTLDAEHVLVTASGAVKIVGFGLAVTPALPSNRDVPKDLDRRELEPWGGQEKSAAWDTKRAAGILFELLTLSECDEGSSRQAGAEVTVLRPFFRPSQFAPWIPRAVDELLSRALAAHRSDAYGSARALASALESALASLGLRIDDAHLAAFAAVIERAGEQGAVAGGQVPTPAPAPPARSAAADASEQELDWDFPEPEHDDVAPQQTTGSESPSPIDTPAWDEVTSARGCDARSSAGQAWAAAVANRQRTERDAPAGALLGGRSATIPALPAVRAIAEFERGLEQLRRGDLKAAEAAWSLSLELDPELRAAKANLKLLKKRRPPSSL